MKTYDTVWTIALPEGKGIVYAIGTTRQEAWERACSPDIMDSTRYALEKQGYRAIQVDIVGLGK